WLTTNAPKLMKFEKPVGSLIISDPAVADVTVKSNTEILFFGKMPGVTNVYVYDDEGNKAQTLAVRVRTNRNNMLTLQAGGDQYTFSCTDRCEQVVAIGDGNNQTRAELDSVAVQAERRFTMASQAGNPATSTSTSSGTVETNVGADEEYNEDAGPEG
ncbi:MAG: pilus assembly protein N-terminal domain-containing protein, partial [Pseudomonadota bacterium]